ncbi:MAG: hypothetical protein ABI667_09065 [Sphingomicrobium sp.]
MRVLAFATTAFVLSACQVNEASDNISVMPGGNGSSKPARQAPPNPINVPPPAPVDPNQPPPVHLNPDALPIPAEKSALGAARRLLEYCDAVATQRYPDAYRLWSDDGRASGMTVKQFADSSAKYRTYDCSIGTPGDTEGAAGSIYVEIPLTVTGALARGGGFRLEGPMTLRRVNDVDGSTAEQRRWHIASSGLKPRP